MINQEGKEEQVVKHLWERVILTVC